LTGGEALDHGAVATAISRAARRRVEYAPIEEEEARRMMAEAGLSAERTERLLGFYRLVRAGACARVSEHVAALLGRPPMPFELFARDNADCWRSSLSRATGD
jgi:hypothetical protein